MPDPVLRRVASAAVVYWEMDPSGPRVSRIVVDVPLPFLEDSGPPLPPDPPEAAAALAGWIVKTSPRREPPFGTPRADEPETVTTAQWEVAA